MLKTDPTHFNALAAIPVLAGLNPAAVDLLAEEGIVREFAENTWVLREGQTGNSFFIISDGIVEVVKYAESPGATSLATLRTGTFFGEMCVVDPVPRAASVRTLTPVKLVEIKALTLYHLFQRMPDQYAIVILNLARDLARRLRKLDEAFAAKAD